MKAPMPEELKPLSCPFCGGEPEMHEIGNEHTARYKVEFICQTRGCRGSCTGCASFGNRHSKEQVQKWALDQWNKRAARPEDKGGGESAGGGRKNGRWRSS